MVRPGCLVQSSRTNLAQRRNRWVCKCDGDSRHHFTVTLFFALLAFGGAAVVVLAPVVSFAMPGSSTARDIRSFGLIGGFVAALVATLGSLYLSEIVGYAPCRFCWYQRFFMYPSALVLGLSLLMKKPKLAWLAVAMSVIGFCISVYHRLEQQYPDTVGSSCAVDNPCWGRYVNEFGWVTIPTMAAVAFALVFTLVPLSLRGMAGESE